MNLSKIFVIFIPFSLLAVATFPEEVTIFSMGCDRATACQTNFQTQEKDFVLRWKDYREGRRYFLEIEMEGGTFPIPTAPHLIRDDPFPFKLYIFSDSLKLYGSFSNDGTAALFTNYFSRDENGFHYLGRFPFLAYDRDSGYFVGRENISPDLHLVSYYKLEDNSLVLQKTENALENDVPF